MIHSANRLLVLVDGSSFLFRAYYALPPLTNSKGEPTGAILGVGNMLKSMLQRYDTPHVVVVFDAPGKTFRDEIYEQYKAHRAPAPDDLVSQIKPLHQLIQAMGLPLLCEPGVEADDVIGTLAIQACGKGYDVVISTGDKDMAQLVNDRITLENTMSKTQLDRAGVEKKFGVRPDQIIDYLALMGDSSDNIPGVPGVGPKTAAKWLQHYQTVDNLIAHVDEIKGKVGEKLRTHIDDLRLSQRLAKIICDVPIEHTLDALKRSDQDLLLMRELLIQLDFTAWLKQLDNPKPDAEPDLANAGNNTANLQVQAEQAVDYQMILDQQSLDVWLQRLEQADYFAFDSETTSLNYMQAEIVGISFAVSPYQAAYVPLGHDYLGVPEQLDRDKVLEQMRPLLENPDKAKLGQNLKYDAHVLKNHGIHLSGIAHDTMLESYVLNSVATRHNMDALAKTYLGRETIHYEDVAGKGAKQIPFSQVAIEQAGPYAAEDADITLQLHQHLWPQLQQVSGLATVYQQIEIALLPVLVTMEENGVLVDRQCLQEQSTQLQLQMTELEKQAYDCAGQEFNLGSPKQIQEILYDKLNIPVRKKTPKGQPSTAESVLQELAEDYDLPKIILEHRSLSKLKSTYTDSLPEQINPQTGRVHTSYHQAVAATGRLSSSDPNLQNIPIRTEQGRQVRQAFIAAPGNQLIAADYSQIELRIMAHLSQDERLLTAFSEGEDIHRATAAEVFGVDLEAVSNDQRRSAKAINFGLIYGMSAFGLAKQLGIDRKQAQDYINQYFERYPGVKRYMNETRQIASEQGYVETLFGRRLYLPEIQSRNAQRRQYAERTAINAPMQGTAADIIKRAMITLDHWAQKNEYSVKMIMQVHDELVFEIPQTQIEASLPLIRQQMTQAAQLDVPLVVDIGVGDNWDDAH
ncbi:MAG TPA: DNA polymerase I [Crenotrichaceae bacterium]|nr:DNA polymerase I [Crenotrichaceae bacterium]